MKKVNKILMIMLSVISINLIVNYIKMEYLVEEEGIVLEETEKTLAVYLEDDDGNYSLSNSNKFPTDGYKFNEDKSKCRHNSKMSWENDKLRIKVKGADKCNVYFDKLKPIGVDDKDYTKGESVKYLDLKWLVVEDSGDNVTLILKENYKTGEYGQTSDWESSSANELINNDFLDDYPLLIEEIEAGGIIYNEDSLSFVRLIKKSEVSTAITNKSDTPYWTMTSSGNSDVVFATESGELTYSSAESASQSLYQGYVFNSESGNQCSLVRETVNVCSTSTYSTTLSSTSDELVISEMGSTSSQYYSSSCETTTASISRWDYCSSSGPVYDSYSSVFKGKVHSTASGCKLYTSCTITNETYEMGLRPVITVEKI